MLKKNETWIPLTTSRSRKGDLGNCSASREASKSGFSPLILRAGTARICGKLDQELYNTNRLYVQGRLGLESRGDGGRGIHLLRLSSEILR